MLEMDAREIGKRLRTLRGALTEQQAADKVGLSRSAWSQYERGKRIPKDNIKIRISKVFGKGVSSLFFEF